jgi:hypothetical protein
VVKPPVLATETGERTPSSTGRFDFALARSELPWPSSEPEAGANDSVPFAEVAEAAAAAAASASAAARASAFEW